MLKSAALVLAIGTFGLLGCEQPESEGMSELTDDIGELSAAVESDECCENFQNVGGCNTGGQHRCCPFPPYTQLQCMEECAGEYYSCRNESWCYNENWMGEGGCNSDEEAEQCRELCELRCSTGGFCDRYSTGNYCICWGSDPEDPPPI